MATERILRETPFNGYNRDDVKAYIRKQDDKIKDLENSITLMGEEKEESELSLKKEIERLNEEIRALNDTLSQRADENFTLSEQIMKQKDTVIDQVAAIQQKTSDLDTLRAENEALKKDIDRQVESIIKGKISEYESQIKAKDERIKFFEGIWDQAKKDYAVYTDVRKNVDEIMADAKSKAEEIISAANEEANAIRNKASEDRIKVDNDIDGLKKKLESFIDTLGHGMDPTEDRKDDAITSEGEKTDE